MMNVLNLKAEILDAIKNDNFDLKDLTKILGSINHYTSSPTFMNYVGDIVTILITDRDANNIFTANDIILISKDVIAMTSLISAILLILNSIPSVQITYTPEDTELLIFKLTVYIFLVIIPQKTNVYFTLAEKEALVTTSVLIYQFLLNSKMLKNLVSEVGTWFKSKGYCNCFTTPTPVIEQKMPILQKQLLVSLNQTKDKELILKTLNQLNLQSIPI